MRNRLWAAAFGLAVLSWSRPSAAEAPVLPTATHCAEGISRSNVAACALATSPFLLESMAVERAEQGRRDAARPFLPSNPTLAASVSSRVGPSESATNWAVALGQEFEVAGQSWLRVEVAEGELRAQGHRLTAARRDVVAQAWSAYFKVLGAQERLALAKTLEQATATVANTVRAMVTNGLTSEIDADIAETAFLKATTDRLTLESTLAAAKAMLSSAIGAQPSIVVNGALDPLRPSSVAASSEQQPLLLAIKEQYQSSLRRIDLLQRERIPNPTFSVFAQNDGFNERVLGIGLAVPIPLPQPVGRTGAAQTAEARALAERAEAELKQIRRVLQAELTAATAEFEAASKARELYPAERVQRALTRLQTIAVQVKAARLPARDALLAQQALVEQLRAEIETREALCLASVRLARAAGTPLEGDAL